jgi:hypothetical protein
MYFCQVFVSLNHVYQIGYNAKMKFLTLFALVTLMPSFVYAQTASLETLLKGIVGFTNNTLIPFLVGIAFLFFVINVFRYFILNGENEKGQENAKNLAMYSVAAFVFFSFVLSFGPVFPWSPIPFQRIEYHLSFYAQLRHKTSTN